MKLVGYTKDKKENSFREPVYTDSKGVNFTHVVDNRHNITAFKLADLNENEIQKLYLSKKFTVGSKGALVFVGKENYLHYNIAPNAIEEIIHYLNDHSTLYNVNGILDQSMLLKNRIFSDHFVVDNFVVKMNPDEEQITLSFDFPSPKKETQSKKDSKETSNNVVVNKKESPTTDDKEAIFSNAIKHLNSVDMNFELKLKLRAEERRSKLKTFNYQFKLNQNSSKPKKTSE
jgi:hypothetical protein